MADWSLLPKDILELLVGRLETCFEIVQFRSVCSSWWSALPPQVYLYRLGNSTNLPVFNHNPRFGGDEPCILKKIPVFILRFKTPFGGDYLLAGMSETKSGRQTLLSPLEKGCRFKYGDGVTLNTLSSQIISLGQYYKINFYATTTRRYRTRRESYFERVAYLPMDSEDGRDFAVVAGVLGVLMMYRSFDKKWTIIQGRFKAYRDMVSFKGKFYVVDMSGRGHVFVIEPSFVVTEISPVTQSNESYHEILVVSGDELLLVQRFTPGKYGDEHMRTWFRLFRLEEESQRRWVRVNDLEDRVMFLGVDWNLCYMAKELPGMKGNCIVFIAPKSLLYRYLVFDLVTRRTSKAITECRGYMRAFHNDEGSLVSCGIVTCQIHMNLDFEKASHVILPISVHTTIFMMLTFVFGQFNDTSTSSDD